MVWFLGPCIAGGRATGLGGNPLRQVAIDGGTSHSCNRCRGGGENGCGCSDPIFGDGSGLAGVSTIKSGSKSQVREGFWGWQNAVGWAVVSARFLGQSFRTIRAADGGRSIDEATGGGGRLFGLTALQRPSFVGTCSSAVGAGFGAVLPGPGVMTDGGVITFRFAGGIVGASVAWWAVGMGSLRACLQSANRTLGGRKES